jgi:SH3 domain protein
VVVCPQRYAFRAAGGKKFSGENQKIQGSVAMPMRMKSGWIVLLFLLVAPTVAAAKTMFISEEFEVTMRTGPANDRKIIAMVPTGREVELINAGDEWSVVRLPSGKEGWIQNRFLTDKPPSALQLASLETRHTEVQARFKEQQKKLSELTAENQTLLTQLKQAQDAVSGTQGAFDKLKKDSAEFIKFKAEYEKNRKELIETREKAEKFESQLNRLAGSQLDEGFLYGGGLVVFGFLAGFILKKPKRRSGLM